MNVVRPSRERNVLLLVLAKPAMRVPGSVLRRRASTPRRPVWTVRELTLWPGGSVTTASSGALLPPVPWKLRAICWLVTHPSLPGTENFCFSAFVADPAEAIPTSVIRTQKQTTSRLCASTTRVTRRIGPDAAKKCALRWLELGEDEGAPPAGAGSVIACLRGSWGMVRFGIIYSIKHSALI